MDTSDNDTTRTPLSQDERGRLRLETHLALLQAQWPTSAADKACVDALIEVIRVVHTHLGR